MSSRQVVRRARNPPIAQLGRRSLWRNNVSVNARNVIRMAMRRRRDINRGINIARNASRAARNAIHWANRFRALHQNRRMVTITGRATGTTHTTTRMIVRKTPREQRFLRKMFKNRPIKQKYVNRFGFSWMGAKNASHTVWYSVCHLKFNNIHRYMVSRINSESQNVGSNNANNASTVAVGNGPDAFIYIGKCTFSYELYNPTNYIITCYIYDLICKRDTPYNIQYSDATEDANNAPEACMYKGSRSMLSRDSNPTWVVSDPTSEVNTDWNTIGMKPTDYHLFNTLWKVKGMKKIILPPGSSHHHVVVFNPKTKITKASLYYPHEEWESSNKNGLAGLTQATLFGFQGQVAVEDGTNTDNTNTLGTLPGKIVVNCIKKINVWNMDLATQTVISENDLKTTWTKPSIFTDLIEQTAASVAGGIPS